MPAERLTLKSVDMRNQPSAEVTAALTGVIMDVTGVLTKVSKSRCSGYRPAYDLMNQATVASQDATGTGIVLDSTCVRQRIRGRG